MTGAPEVIPRDDRTWPRGAVPGSLVVVLATLALGLGIAAAAAGRSSSAMVAVLVCFIFAFGFGGTLFALSMRCWIHGHPLPRSPQLLLFAALVVCVVLYGFDGSIGGATMAGLFGGMMLANAWAVRAARVNRPHVDEAEAAIDKVPTTARDGAPDASADHGYEGTQDAPVGHVLREALAGERERSLAWLIAGAVVTAACLAVGAPEPVTFTVVFGGALGLVWVLRRLWGVWFALRDFKKAATSPRSAYVVLLRDPAPQMRRPLLGVWFEPPVVRSGRMPNPKRVYRCDDELDALECRQGGVVVHEAWVDSGPRLTSKPRWVAADAGIALPHRRSLFGRWYMSSLVGGERPDPPERLTLRPPHPDTERIVELGRDHGRSIAAFGWRFTGLVALGLLAYVVT